jgi:hypothetical protein
MVISPALRGISLILALLDEKVDFGKRLVKTSALRWLQEGSGLYLTGQVFAAYSSRERIYAFSTIDFGAPAGVGFRKAQLASACLPKPRRRQGPF